MSKRPAQNGEHGAWDANGEAPAQKVKVDPAQDGQDKPSDEVRSIMNLACFGAVEVTPVTSACAASFSV